MARLLGSATMANEDSTRRIYSDEYILVKEYSAETDDGIAKLGAKLAGLEGRQRLLAGLPGPPTRRRDAMVKALAMLDESPAR
jgi:hypothetical protein